MSTMTFETHGVGHGGNPEAGYMLPSQTSATVRLVGHPICPDLLDYDALGEADNVRGRVVRAFFWLMRLWRVK